MIYKREKHVDFIIVIGAQEPGSVRDLVDEASVCCFFFFFLKKKQMGFSFNYLGGGVESVWGSVSCIFRSLDLYREFLVSLSPFLFNSFVRLGFVLWSISPFSPSCYHLYPFGKLWARCVRFWRRARFYHMHEGDCSTRLSDLLKTIACIIFPPSIACERKCRYSSISLIHVSLQNNRSFHITKQVYLRALSFFPFSYIS